MNSKRSRAKCNWQRRKGLTHHQCRHDPVGRWSQKPLKDHQGRPARPGRPHHHPTPNRGDPIEIGRTIGNRCIPLLLGARLFTNLRSKSRRFPKKRATKAAAIAIRRSTRIANPFLEPRVKGARTRTTGRVEIRGKGGTAYPTRNIGQIPLLNRAPTPTPPPPPLLPRLLYRERKRIARARVTLCLCSNMRPLKNAPSMEQPRLVRDRR